MRAVAVIALPFALSLALAASSSAVAQDQTTPPPAAAPATTPAAPITRQAPAAITAPQKDDTAMPQVPQTDAQKAAAQQTAPPPATPPMSAPSGDAPSAPTPENTLRRNVQLVVLDMVVVDAKGHAVTDLTRDDFHITESDEGQTVRNFDPPGKYTPDPNLTIDSTADLDRLAPRAPVNIVLLDEFNTRFEDMAFARYSLEKWLKSQPDKLATPTMLVAVDLQHFTVLRDYTQNKQAIIDALKHHFVAYPWQTHNFAWQGERYATAFITLRRVAEASIGHLGHKNMIWIGRGFPTVNRARFTVDDENRVNSAMQQTVNELRDARVTLYTIDPAGVMTDPGKYGNAAALFAPFGGDPDFTELAKATGGRSLYGRNDVDAEIGTSIRDGSSFYTLTYRPTDSDRDIRKFRHIKVTVNRPGLTVVSRQGYFLDRRPARVNAEGGLNKRLAQELIGAGTSNMVYDSVPFTVQPSNEANAYVVRVEGGPLVWTYATDTEPRKTKVIVTVTTFDKKGKALKQEGKVFTAEAPSTVPPAGRLERPIGILYKIEPDPKAMRARFVVRVDATGRMGTADLDLSKAGATAKSQPAPPPAATTQPPATTQNP